MLLGSRAFGTKRVRRIWFRAGQSVQYPVFQISLQHHRPGETHKICQRQKDMFRACRPLRVDDVAATLQKRQCRCGSCGCQLPQGSKAGPETTPRIASGEGANLLEPGLEAIVLRRELPRASRLSGTGHWFEDFRLLYWQPLTPSGLSLLEINHSF